MTQLSSFPGAPTSVLQGPAVVYVAGNTALAMSKGGIAVEIPHDYENMDFDGKLLPIVGLDRRYGGPPAWEADFLDYTAAMALKGEPGGATATSGGITEITPGLYGEFLVAANYKQNVRTVIRVNASLVMIMEFNWALFTITKMNGDPKDPTYHVRCEARQDASAASLGVAPYTIKFADTLATVVTADP